MEERHPSQFNYLIGPYMIGKFLAFFPTVVFLGKGAAEICGMGHLPPGPLVPPALGWKRNGTNSVQCPVRNMYYALSFMLCSNDIRKLESGY